MLRHITGLIVLGTVIYIAFTMPLCIGVPCVETTRDTIERWYGGEEASIPDPLPTDVATTTSPAISPTVKDGVPNRMAPTSPKTSENTPGGLTSLKNILAKEEVLTSTGIVVLTNLERVAMGITPLRENSALRAAAEAKITDLFVKQYFAHESPTGEGPSDLAHDAGYAYILVGENLALGNFENDQAVVTAWMNSPGHRANILKAGYQEIGVAVRKGVYEGRSVWIAVQEFGVPRSACPITDESLSALIDTSNKSLDSIEADLLARKQVIDATSPRDPSYNTLVDEYNAVVADYNTLLRKTRELVDAYNTQVRTFNSCLERYTG